MLYIGEHFAVGFTAKILLWVSFASIFFAAICYYISCYDKRTNYRTWRFHASNLFRLHFLSIAAVVGFLTYIIESHYFEFSYVWKHSSKDLSFAYLLSSVWSGQEGSILIWIFFQGFIGMLIMKKTNCFERHVLTIISISQLFLMTAIININLFGLKFGADIFQLLREAPENIGNSFFKNPDYLQNIKDGAGLNPLLQNVWMKIHPPVLFLGFALAIVPFAYTVAALWKRCYQEWLKLVLPWISITVFVLGLGLLMGGAWAYQDLTFGGFWQWDPVENSSLVPWIILISSLHLALISKVNNQFLFPAYFLTILSYIFVLYSTFLTRSGLLVNTSAHAFGNTGQTFFLILNILVFLIVSMFLLFNKWRKFPKNENEQIFSREFWMFAGSVVLMLSAFQIIFSTSVPLLNKIFGTSVSLSTKMIEYYNNWQIPFASVILIVIAFTQFLKYRSNDKILFIKKVSFSFILSVCLSVLLYFYLDNIKPYYLALAFASIFVIISSLDNLFRFFHESTNKAAIISHLGLGIFLSACLLAFSQSKILTEKTNSSSTKYYNSFNEGNIVLHKGDILPVGPYYISYPGFSKEKNTISYQLDFLDKNNKGNYFKKFSVFPKIITNSAMGNVYVPDTKHFFNKDIFTYIKYAATSDYIQETDNKLSNYISNDVIVIKTLEFPFIFLVWTGAIIMLSGFIYSFVKRKKNRNADEADCSAMANQILKQN
ncbi:MAG: cytochrome c biogenesis protein CcsA [Bacteroidetes bacterium]|nr:cytochrome c biogenesis protein CcsA [Bacteroidota bacterium]